MNSTTKSDDGFGILREPWYDIDYHLASIDESDTHKWIDDYSSSDELYLPKSNAYIPSTEELELSEDLPEDAKNGPRIELPITPPTLLKSDNYG